MNRLQLFQESLRQCTMLLRNNPGFSPLESAANQLQYLCELESRKISDRSRLKDINLGILSVREFETRFPEFDDLISEVCEHVEAMRFNR